MAKYVLDPQPFYLKHAKPTPSGGLAAASGSPSGPSNDASGPALEADTATQRDPSPEAAQTPRLTHAASGTVADQAQLQVPYGGVQDQQQETTPVPGISEQAMPALSGFSASQPTDTPFGSNFSNPAGKPALYTLGCRSRAQCHAVQCCVRLDSQSASGMIKSIHCTATPGYYASLLAYPLNKGL